MRDIHKIGGVEVIKNKTNEYHLQLENNNPAFWKLFPWKLLNILKSTETANKINVFFKANSVETLREFLTRKLKRISYDDALHLFTNINEQLESLEKNGLGIPVFDMKDIIVVDNKTYFFINQQNVFTIDSQKAMTISTPIPKTFCAPEICKIKTLPVTIPYQAGLFSIAALTTFALTNSENPDYKVNLESIWQTPLYWALMRCLDPIPDSRVFLLI